MIAPKLRTFALAVSVALAVMPAMVSAQTGPAGRFLQQKHEEVNRILRRAANDDAARRRRTEELRRALGDLLDYDELSRRALGDHWGQHTDAERTQFVSLLRQLVERNYEANLERILEFEVTYGDEAARGDAILVHTEARSRAQRRQPPVAIDYTVRQADGGYRVVDVATDGVSLVTNYRNQFHRIITRDGWAELISRMQRRLDEGTVEGTGTSTGG